MPAPLSAIRPFWLADRAARIRADEGDNIVDRAVPRETLGDLIDALDERAFVGKQELVGAAQSADVLAAEAAALHADDVDAGKPRPIA